MILSIIVNTNRKQSYYSLKISISLLLKLIETMSKFISTNPKLRINLSLVLTFEHYSLVRKNKITSEITGIINKHLFENS